MKRLGLIGSQSATSALVYWETIHQEARAHLGESRTADLLLHCANTAQLRTAAQRGDWRTVTETLTEAGRGLMLAGADGLVICGSVVNPVGWDVRRVLDVPLIDMAHAMAFKLQAFRYRRVALVGVRSAREAQMWQEKLAGITLVQPPAAEQAWLVERCGTWSTTLPHEQIGWKIEAQRIVSALRKSGAQAIVLADHTLARWIKPDESLLPLFDAEEIHAWIAALWALETDRLPAPSCVIA